MESLPSLPDRKDSAHEPWLLDGGSESISLASQARSGCTAFLVEGSGGVQEEDLDVGDVRVYLDNFASESTDYVYYIEKDFDYFYNLEMMKILESNSLDDSFVDKELDILYEDPDINDKEVQRYIYELEPAT